MTGLQEQIEGRRVGKTLSDNEPISYAGISKIINKSYPTAKKKVETNTFTAEEAIKIFKTLFIANSKFEAFEYLFTEQGERNG